MQGYRGSRGFNRIACWARLWEEGLFAQGRALRGGCEDHERPPWLGKGAAGLQLHQPGLGWKKAAEMLVVALKSSGSF